MALKSVPVGPLTRGARRVRRHLEKLGVTVPDFCEEHGLTRHQVERVLNGRTINISVDLAVAMSDATSSAEGPIVEPRDFMSSTAREENKATRKQPSRAASR